MSVLFLIWSPATGSGLAHRRSLRNTCWMEGGRNREKDEGAEGQRPGGRERRVGGKLGPSPSRSSPLSPAIPPQVPLLIPRPGPYTRAST